MNKKFSFSFQKFFEERYLAVFGVLFATAILLASLVFYTTPPRGVSEEAREPLPPDDVLNESIIVKVNELLDVRSEYFQRLRNLPPSVKNPF